VTNPSERGKMVIKIVYVCVIPFIAVSLVTERASGLENVLFQKVNF